MSAAKQPIPEQALDDRHAFIGMTGSGKTYNAGGSVERLMRAGKRVVIVDPLDVWWGLRLAPDGKTPSDFSPAIIGGAHADLPLNEHAGKLIGETVATTSESCIVALSDLPSKAAERRFMLTFLDALYRKANGEPVHLIFDEADLWAPQKGGEPQLQSLMESIVRRGRVKGLISWLITQRPAVLSKDVLSQVDGLIAFKLTASQDRDALGAWIEGAADRATGREILATLPTMQQGQGVVWIPGRGILETAFFPPKTTFDSSRSPKRGEKKRATTLVPLDVPALKERLATVEADLKANDPARLKTEIQRLQAELRKTGGGDADLEARLQSAEEERNDLLAKVRQAEEFTREFLQELREQLSKAASAVHVIESLLEGQPLSVGPVPDFGPPRSDPDEPDLPKTWGKLPAPSRPETNGTARSAGLTGPQEKVLSSLGFWKSLGHHAPSREQIAAAAGYSPGSGNFANLIGGLRTAGFVEIPEVGRVSLLPAAPYQPLTAAEGRDKMFGVLSGPQRMLVGAALERPGDITREELAAATGYSSGSGNFANLIGSLCTLGIFTKPGARRVALSDWARSVLREQVQTKKIAP